MYKKYIIFVAILAIFPVQYLMFKHFNQEVATLYKSLLSALSSKTQNSYDDSELLEQLKSMQLGLENLNERIGEIERLGLKDQQAQELASTMEPEDESLYGDSAELGRAYTSEPINTPENDPFIRAEKIHQSEMIDTNWTDEIQIKLADAFSVNDSLKAGKLETVDCRQNTCDIRMSTDASVDSDQQFYLEYALYAELFQMGLPQGKMTREFRPDGSVGWKFLYNRGATTTADADN